MCRCLPVLLVLALGAAACGDDGGGNVASDTDSDTDADDTTTTSTTTASTTTTVPEITAADLAEPGPYEVGVTTRELPTGNLVEIWYPATKEADGRTETYRVQDFIGPLLAPLIPPEVDDSFSVEAARDASPSRDGPFPVVLFSHGSALFRLQSTTLTRHLASWGMVVAAPDHPTRELKALLGPPAEDPPSSADDLRAALALLADAPGDPVLGDLADFDRVGLGGHSAGGGTILAVAGDDGIDGYVSYASDAGDDDLPDVPSLFMAGGLDEIVAPERTRGAFERAPTPTWYWEIGTTGHLAFSDLCAVGSGEATLLDLAVAAGIGDLVPENLLRLATDGCEPPNRSVEEIWPAVHQASTGFYRWIFGIDGEPIGLTATSVPDVVIDSH